jgi:Protein of unknown function (DUF3500)
MLSVMSAKTESLAQVVGLMTAAARDYLQALSPSQRTGSLFAFDDPRRTSWEFEPLGAGNPRYGVSWPELREEQQYLAHQLLNAGLSDVGVRKAETIREVEAIQHPADAARSYSLWFYGEPALDRPWSWRFEGHHFSVTFSICGRRVSNTPFFIGVSPTCVHDNSANPVVAVGTRPLASEEDLSQSLWSSLDEEQRHECEIMLPDLLDRTPHVDLVQPLPPRGLRVDRLRHDQRGVVQNVIRTFMGNVAAPFASARWREFESAGLDDVWLTAARANIRSEPYGHARPDGFYYRLQSPTFLYEYDDVQWGWQDTGHIHTIWRDFKDDFGLRTVKGV